LFPWFSACEHELSENIKKAYAAIGLAITKAHTVIEQYHQPLVEQKRSDPGKAESISARSSASSIR
jgi:hypothetical protein